MKIMLINNAGAGFADHLEIPEGMSLEQLFERQLPGARPEDYLIRLNRQPAARHERLQEGDRVSMTPSKIEGATPAPGGPLGSALTR